MNTRRLWLSAAVTAATIGFAGIEEAAVPSVPIQDRPECPHDWRFKEGLLPLIGPIINVPEFHDCQRFITEGATPDELVYDSMFAVFASFTLDNLVAQLDTVQHTTGAGSVAVAAAVVYAEGHYRPLAIRDTLSCLYLYRDRAQPGQLRAKMVPMKATTGACTQPINPDRISGGDLEVIRTPVEGFEDSDYPAVARWEWDKMNNEYYVGIKCGAAWCEVGRAGFRPTPGHQANPNLPRKFRRTQMIKGWYDEQLLAVAASSGRLNPAGVMGTIFPDSALGDHNALSAFQSRWVPAAHVALSAHSDVYKSKFNLDHAPVGGQLNTIHLCYGTKRQCIGYGLSWFRYWLTALKGPSCQQGWWARIDAARGGSKYMCITRRPNTTGNMAVPIPGTVRWRWMVSDEGSWARCLQGCCELIGGP